MTHEGIVAALKGDYRSDSATEQHNCYPVRRPLTIITDPRDPHARTRTVSDG